MLTQKSTKVLLLTSGGLDSTACLAYYLNRKNLSVDSLFIDYGQLSINQELSAAKKICKHYKIKLKKISVSGMESFSQGIISGRNAMLLNIALMFFKNPIGIISIGIHAGTNYPDCSKEFVTQMQSLFDLYKSGTVVIDAPFLAWSKPQIWEFCKQQNVPIQLTYSCESGSSPACGNCLSCRDLEVLRATK